MVKKYKTPIYDSMYINNIIKVDMCDRGCQCVLVTCAFSKKMSMFYVVL